MFHYTELGGQRAKSGRGKEGGRRRMSHSRRRSRAAVSGLTERERATGEPTAEPRLRRRGQPCRQTERRRPIARGPSPLVARIAPGERGDERIQTRFSTKVPKKGWVNREILICERLYFWAPRRDPVLLPLSQRCMPPQLPPPPPRQTWSWKDVSAPAHQFPKHRGPSRRCIIDRTFVEVSFLSLIPN